VIRGRIRRLAAGQATLEDAPERLRKGLAKHPVPLMLLARLAIDHRWQGQGVGKALHRVERIGGRSREPSENPLSE
jgi:GNAT superfamily N-acetyltransferase